MDGRDIDDALDRQIPLKVVLERKVGTMRRDPSLPARSRITLGDS
jgi:hypothetical protein